MKLDQYITPAECAKILGMSRSYIYANQDKLPFARRMPGSGALRISVRALGKWQGLPEEAEPAPADSILHGRLAECAASLGDLASPAAIWSRAGELLMMNASAASLLGFARDWYARHSPLALVLPADRHDVELWSSTCRGVLRCRVVSSTGELLYARAELVPAFEFSVVVRLERKP